MRQILVIPNYHPPLANNLLKNRWTAARLKKKCTEIFWGNCLDQRLVKASTKRLVEITITYPSTQRGRRADPDAFFKATLDALVKCNMLMDDSQKWCDFTQPKIDTGAFKATTIILTDIEKCDPMPAEGSVHPQYVKPRGKK